MEVSSYEFVVSMCPRVVFITSLFIRTYATLTPSSLSSSILDLPSLQTQVERRISECFWPRHKWFLLLNREPIGEFHWCIWKKGAEEQSIAGKHTCYKPRIEVCSMLLYAYCHIRINVSSSRPHPKRRRCCMMSPPHCQIPQKDCVQNPLLDCTTDDTSEMQMREIQSTKWHSSSLLLLKFNFPPERNST
jgi:hypothetical protein